MKLYSTNHQVQEVGLKEAVFKGLPDDNGLFMPEKIPALPPSFFENISKLSFQDIAFEVTKTLTIDEFSDQDLRNIIDDVLIFDAPAVKVNDHIYSLELYHGPSLAFKDFGARFMARVMSHFIEEGEEVNILVATSGDTGGAVAQGFYKMPGIRVTILYPSGKVSELQEKQLTTLGENVTALEVDGTFDDCQKLVKQAFLDKDLNRKIRLTSANSINISRLIPQSFYYFYGYAQLQKLGKPVVFCTPSGNFGNLCGGLLAKRMGLPIEKLVAATNVNDVVPEYLSSGLFTPRPSQRTISNAMDVGNPSNFARIMDLYGSDLEKIKSEIVGKRYTDEETRRAMKEVYEQSGYILDPHGAVGYLGLTDYLAESGKDAAGVFLETAHPAKFIDEVESTLNRKIDLPERLKELLNKEKKSEKITADIGQLKNFLLK